MQKPKYRGNYNCRQYECGYSLETIENLWFEYYVIKNCWLYISLTIVDEVETAKEIPNSIFGYGIMIAKWSVRTGKV